MKKGIMMPVLAILVAAAVLFGLSAGLNGIAAANAREDHLNLLKMMSPGSENFTLEAYDGEDTNIRSVHKGEKGFVIETVTYGYAGEITVYVGVTLEGKVSGLVVREALTDVEFLSQFLNSSGSFEVATSGADAFSGATAEAEPEGDTVAVDALTGATVTSKAVVRCINSAVAYVTGADATTAATSWGG